MSTPHQHPKKANLHFSLPRIQLAVFLISLFRSSRSSFISLKSSNKAPELEHSTPAHPLMQAKHRRIQPSSQVCCPQLPLPCPDQLLAYPELCHQMQLVGATIAGSPGQGVHTAQPGRDLPRHQRSLLLSPSSQSLLLHQTPHTCHSPADLALDLESQPWYPS